MTQSATTATVRRQVLVKAPIGEASEHKWGVLLSVLALDLGLPYEELSAKAEIANLPPMAERFGKNFRAKLSSTTNTRRPGVRSPSS